MDVLLAIIAVLVYPGLLTAVGLGAFYGLLVGQGATWPDGAGLHAREGLAAAGSVAAAGLALATLPWPWHPAGGAGAWLWAWTGFELAFLLPLLPPLAAGVPSVVRAAIREAQLGVLARAAIWAALAPALSAHLDWRPATAPAHLLALVAALLAFPAAVGWGPFASEERITPGGVTAGLATPTRSLDGWARDVRSGALLAAILVAGLPVRVGPPWLGLLVVAAGVASAGLLLRRLTGRIPRLTLPAALRLCALWALPLAGLASLALAVMG
ncbi:MAG: hypothetical protein HXY37_16940 [Chloroflexi bacterium]|nr:hypothetical protein [Chloroflexota bacterium]